MAIEGKIAQFQIIPRYEITLFGRTYYIIESTDEVPVIVRIANTGQFLVTPKVKVKVIGSFGQTKTKDLFSANVLRHSERLLLQEEPPVCSRCKTPISAVFNGLFFGRYTLSAEMTFDNANKKIFATTEFWAFPIRLIGLISLISLISLMSLIRLIRHKKYPKKRDDLHRK